MTWHITISRRQGRSFGRNRCHELQRQCIILAQQFDKSRKETNWQSPGKKCDTVGQGTGDNRVSLVAQRGLQKKGIIFLLLAAFSLLTLLETRKRFIIFGKQRLQLQPPVCGLQSVLCFDHRIRPIKKMHWKGMLGGWCLVLKRGMFDAAPKCVTVPAGAIATVTD